MKIEIGKEYITRNGLKAKVTGPNPMNGDYPYAVKMPGEVWYATADGKFMKNKYMKHSLDLIKEAFMLEVGKFYKTRDGSKIEIVYKYDNNYVGVNPEAGLLIYTTNGNLTGCPSIPDLDIIDIWCDYKKGDRWKTRDGSEAEISDVSPNHLLILIDGGKDTARSYKMFIKTGKLYTYKDSDLDLMEKL